MTWEPRIVLVRVATMLMAASSTPQATRRGAAAGHGGDATAVGPQAISAMKVTVKSTAIARTRVIP